jgi:hypothetical protein
MLSMSEISGHGFTDAERITDDLLLVRNGHGYGVYSLEAERLVVPAKYDEIGRLTDEYFRVGKSGLYGVYSLNIRGLIVPLAYVTIELECGNLVLNSTKRLSLPV